MQKLAILGGSFNPIHWGHLLMAETALTQAALDHVIWVPTYQPPHRAATQLLAYQHRMAMVQLAIANHPQFLLSTIEQDASGMSYAIDTLTALQSHYPDSQWFWIIGLDAFQSLPRWYRRRDLAPQCQWLVAPRLLPVSDSADVDPIQHTVQQMAQQAIALRWQMLTMPLVAVSSSLIRQYCGDRRSIRYLVPDGVRQYISVHQFYTKS